MTTGVVNGVSTIDAVRDAMPDGYSLRIVIGKEWGYVQVEPPSRPGNRGPRLPRYVTAFQEGDTNESLDSALLTLLGEIQSDRTP